MSHVRVRGQYLRSYCQIEENYSLVIILLVQDFIDDEARAATDEEDNEDGMEDIEGNWMFSTIKFTVLISYYRYKFH